MSVKAILAVMMLLPVLCCEVIAQKAQIPVEDFDQWQVELFAGNASGGGFIQGPRRGCGGPGALAFDDYGNTFVGAGSIVYVITAEGAVRLLAGAPGMPGAADGTAGRACFGGINAICFGPDGALYVSDVANSCIKKLYRDKAGDWMVATVAGVPGQRGHKDGPGREALLDRPEGLAFDSKGNLYTMDQDWLRRIAPDGQVTTLNFKGGTGKVEDGPLESARFNRIMGSGAISVDSEDNLYQADLWNNVMRKADLKADPKVAAVKTIVGNLPWKPGDPRSADGDAMKEVRTFGINGAVYDQATGRVYFKCADEGAIRCLCPDGVVRTLGPLSGGKGLLAEGPLKNARGDVYLCGTDPQGRVYAGAGGMLFRFYRNPPYPKAATVKTPNPLLKIKPVETGDAKQPAAGLEVLSDKSVSGQIAAGPAVELPLADFQCDPTVTAGAKEYWISMQVGYPGVGRAAAAISCRVDAAGKVDAQHASHHSSSGGVVEHPVMAVAAKTGLIVRAHHQGQATGDGILVNSIWYSVIGKSGQPVADSTPKAATNPPTNCVEPALATNGEGFLLVWRELCDRAGIAPRYALKAMLLDPAGKPHGEPFEIAASASEAVAAFDGTQYVVAYENSGSIYARRVSTEGKLIDAMEAIKIGGQWEHRPSIASNGREVVITGSRRPWPNPWGWNGPAAISIGRLTRDGKTPERFSLKPEQIADGGFAGLLDRSQWKGVNGWPAGRPGGFHATRNGYWPHLYSTVCWDGKTWVAAWVRAKMRDMSLVDYDLFAGRVDPTTMMPTAEPVLVAGGVTEPGAQGVPMLASVGDGRSLMVYQTVGADGNVRVAARMLAGGPLAGPERLEKPK